MREEAGLTQRELADRIKQDQRLVAQLARGRTKGDANVTRTLILHMQVSFAHWACVLACAIPADGRGGGGSPASVASRPSAAPMAGSQRDGKA